MSGPCSTLAVSPGGPFSLRMITFISELFWGWLFFSSYHISLYLGRWKVWCSAAPSPEWIGAPESASLLEMGPGMWLHSLSREQAIDAARQLHRDVCLMTTNLDVIDQYMLCLQGMVSKILELSLKSRGFPSEAVAAGAMGPWACRAAVQMEAMWLWRRSLDPVLFP